MSFVNWFGWTILALGIVTLIRVWENFFGGDSDDDQDGPSGGGPRLRRLRVPTDRAKRRHLRK